ncbi:MAG: S8 family serine peptidase [Candidatus Kapabacteria bacterium]|nr:S8 family serine peptidase [Candidatus Kapabacteria bacterium]
MSLVIGQEDTFPFLDIKSMGAHEFIRQNPDCDGRGVVIFILDNSVDPSIPGMISTSTSKPKVIDMQDFSNQLVLNLKEAEFETNNSLQVLMAGDIMISGADKLKFKPFDEKYFYGVIDEKKHFMNSPVSDLNSNGRKDDKFAVIAFKIKITESIVREFIGMVKPEIGSMQWVYYVDENSNGSIDDEIPRFTYKYNLDYFNFYSGDKGKRPLVVMSANLASDSHKMVINTCDGSHGTHCGGIACGYEIYNKKGNNGVAPGAFIVSLKIGSNLLSGGATTTEAMKKAYEYGIDFLKESGIKYGVYSMSYGIGSETPGRSEIEKYLNEFALKHENVIVITSNGNNGPGINSTGNPAGANNILSVGAMLPVDVLKNLYGSLRNTPWVTNFSSRGGESGKPDVIAPGGASSSVPAFERGDAFWGTSMSCPQAAGAAAILFSAANHFNIKTTGAMLKKALKFGAKPLAGYSHLDQGIGLINIQNSFDYLTAMNERREFDKSADYSIETANSYYSDKKGSAAFWKASGYFPTGSEKQTVAVKPLFYKELPAETKHNFYRIYNLVSDSPWLKTDKSEIYLRGELGGSFGMIFDSSKITKPGLYSGRISAYPKSEPGSKYADFDVQANIIIPYKFNSENHYSLKIKGEKISIGDIKRFFIETPTGASTAKITLSPVDGKNFGLMAYLYNPDGRNSGTGISTDESMRKDIELIITSEKMTHGIWEIIPASHYQSLNDSYFDLSVQFYMLQSDKPVISKLENIAGSMPSGSFSVMNLGSRLINSTLSGSIEGYMIEKEIKHTGSSIFKKTFKIGNEISQCKFIVEMSDEQYNKSTDISFNIFDEKGESIVSSGLGRKSAEINFRAAKAGTYRIEFEAGFTHSKFESEPWIFNLTEKYYYSESNSLKFDSPNMKIYPGTDNLIKFSTTNPIFVAPDGFKTFGDIELKDNYDNSVIYKQIIKLD